MKTFGMSVEAQYRLEDFYAIDRDKIQRVYDIAKTHDIAIYDALTLNNKYTDDDDVDKYADKYKFINKLKDWYSGKRLLVDTEKFQIAGNTFKEKGYYTALVPNSHPNSEFYKFWEEEARRCIYGYYSGEDWVPGYFYFYLNYSPIEKAIIIDDTAGTGNIRGERVTGFASFWDGDYYYFHYLEECERTGRQASVLKARGKGYSWKGASMMARNFTLIPKSKSVVYASSKEFLNGNDGILIKTWSILSHIDIGTAWSKRRQVKDTDTHKKASLWKTKNGVRTETGFMSEISGVTLGDNVHKLRGKRSKLILFEEGGSFKDLETAWVVSDPSVRQGNIHFGLKIAFGTGGEEGNEFDGLKNLFYKPRVFEVLPLPNIWTENAGHNEVGWFAPTYVNLEGHYDELGNSNMESGKAAVMAVRQEALDNKVAPSTFQKIKAENPLTPEDAILRSSISPFPVQMLSEHLAKLETDSAYKGKSSKGILGLTMEGQVVWEEDMHNKVHIIGTDDVNQLNSDGGIEIFQHPPNQKPPRHTFIIGTDPIDFDKNEVGKGYSLGSTFVMNTLTNRIVAEYTGRPENAKDYYEVVRRLALYYNAEIMQENNIKGMVSYFKNRYAEKLLASKPTILLDGTEGLKLGNRQYGFTASANVLKYGRQLIKEWLETHIPTEEGEESSDKRQLHTIKSTGLLKELIDWHADGNFDRVSSLIALLIFLADTARTRTYTKEETIDDGKVSLWKRAIGRQ